MSCKNQHLLSELQQFIGVIEELENWTARNHLRRQKFGEATTRIQNPTSKSSGALQQKQKTGSPSKFTKILLDTLDHLSEVVEAFA